MEIWKPDVCLYHFPCDDGFAAAWVVKRKWPDVVLEPTNYGLPLPDVDIAGKNLLIADFSYPYETLVELSFKARSMVILDHHKTAQEALGRLPWAGYSINEIGEGWVREYPDQWFWMHKRWKQDAPRRRGRRRR